MTGCCVHNTRWLAAAAGETQLVDGYVELRCWSESSQGYYLISQYEMTDPVVCSTTVPTYSYWSPGHRHLSHFVLCCLRKTCLSVPVSTALWLLKTCPVPRLVRPQTGLLFWLPLCSTHIAGHAPSYAAVSLSYVQSHARGEDLLGCILHSTSPV